MSEAETRDAYVAVEVPLPNGQIVSGKPVPFPVAMKLLGMIDGFYKGGDPDKTILPALAQFAEVTGIVDTDVLAKCPDLSLGELIDVMQRFFYQRRPAPTADATAAGPSVR